MLYYRRANINFAERIVISAKKLQYTLKKANKFLSTWYGNLILWFAVAIAILSVLLLYEPVILLLILVFCILNYVKKPKELLPKVKQTYKALECSNDCVECGAKAGKRGYVSKHKKGCSKAKVKTT
jgi:hypothetical protein